MISLSTSGQNVAAFLLLVLTTACSDVSTTKSVQHSPNSDEKIELSTLNVYKSPTCVCCSKWIKHIEKHGFQSKTHNVDNLSAIKEKHGIPVNLRSCHTAISKNGFVFEGHVPAKFIQQFLNNPPANALGLSVPSMPLGSPGMEVDDKFMPYRVILLKSDGQHEIYKEVKTYEEQF
ncbi:MAG: DUF411 domain-containing protein [Thalassotalea sp.]|nr:DUF411 domain-containing protein [Thalassotalea sp.]MDG2392122.1 DUF411 domain-containing protein [Thalassotalea sp.]